MTVLLVLTLRPAFAGHVPSQRPSDEERGQELWERHCVACHGATNRGDGPATAALVHPVPDLAGKVSTEKPTIDLVLNGRGSMPGFEPTFAWADAKRVVKYMAEVHEEPPAPDVEPPTVDVPAAEP